MPKGKKDAQAENAGQDMPAKEVAILTPADAPQAMDVLTMEQIVSQEIAKIGVPDAKIAELKAAYYDLKINGVEDAEGYKKVKEAVSVVRTVRTGVEKKRVELKELHVVVGRGIDAEAKRLTTLVLEVETPLKNELERVDGEKARIKQDELEKAEARINERINLLIKMGMVFDGSFYSIGQNVSVGVVDVRNMTDEAFATLKSAAQVEADKLEADRKEKERQDQLEKKRIEDERKELENLRKQNDERERENKRRQDEQLKRDQERQSSIEASRRNALAAIGLIYAPQGKIWAFSNSVGGVDISEQEITTAEEATWMERFMSLSTDVSNLRTSQAKKDDEQREIDRKNAEEKAQRDLEQKQADEEKEKARLAALAPDKEKVAAYFASLRNMQAPQIADADLAQALHNFYLQMAANITNFERQYEISQAGA